MTRGGGSPISSSTDTPSRHPDIHHDHVEDGLADGAERALPVRRRGHPVPVVLKDRDQGVAHARLVVHDQDRGPAHRGTLASDAATGTVMVKELPAVGALRTVIVPWWASTIRFVTARPSPMPRAFLV